MHAVALARAAQRRRLRWRRRSARAAPARRGHCAHRAQQAQLVAWEAVQKHAGAPDRLRTARCARCARAKGATRGPRARYRLLLAPDLIQDIHSSSLPAGAATRTCSLARI